MTDLTDYDILVSVQAELDKLKKDYNTLSLANLRLIKLLKDCRYLIRESISEIDSIDLGYNSPLIPELKKLLTELCEVLND